MRLQVCYENIKQLNIDTLRNGEKKTLKNETNKNQEQLEFISNLQAGKV